MRRLHTRGPGGGAATLVRRADVRLPMSFVDAAETVSPSVMITGDTAHSLNSLDYQERQVS